MFRWAVICLVLSLIAGGLGLTNLSVFAKRLSLIFFALFFLGFLALVGFAYLVSSAVNHSGLLPVASAPVKKAKETGASWEVIKGVGTKMFLARSAADQEVLCAPRSMFLRNRSSELREPAISWVSARISSANWQRWKPIWKASSQTAKLTRSA